AEIPYSSHGPGMSGRRSRMTEVGGRPIGPGEGPAGPRTRDPETKAMKRRYVACADRLEPRDTLSTALVATALATPPVVVQTVELTNQSLPAVQRKQVACPADPSIWGGLKIG